MLHGVNVAVYSGAFARRKGENVVDGLGNELLGQADIRCGLDFQNKLAAVVVLCAADGRDNQLAASRTN